MGSRARVVVIGLALAGLALPAITRAESGVLRDVGLPADAGPSVDAGSMDAAIDDASGMDAAGGIDADVVDRCGHVVA